MVSVPIYHTVDSIKYQKLIIFALAILPGYLINYFMKKMFLVYFKSCLKHGYFVGSVYSNYEEAVQWLNFHRSFDPEASFSLYSFEVPDNIFDN